MCKRFTYSRMRCLEYGYMEHSSGEDCGGEGNMCTRSPHYYASRVI